MPKLLTGRFLWIAILLIATAGTPRALLADPVPQPQASPPVFTANQRAAVFAHPIAPVLFTRRIARPTAPQIDVQATQTTRAFSAIGAATTTAMARAACKPTDPPAVVRVRGRVTPGGTLTIDGECFGLQLTQREQTQESGHLVIAGSSVTLPLQIVGWSPTSITATISQVLGVFDQPVRLTVQRANMISNPVDLNFAAAREARQLPTRYIKILGCSWAVDHKDWYETASCDPANDSAFHRFLDPGSPAQQTGADYWQAQAPPGWELDALALQVQRGRADEVGFEDGPPDRVVWKVNWTMTMQSAAVTTDTVFGVTTSQHTHTDFQAAYAVVITASGPAGTMPP